MLGAVINCKTREDCIKMIRERTEYCEGWDEAVVEWLSKRDAL